MRLLGDQLPSASKNSKTLRKVAVVVPIYKAFQNLSANELKALTQLKIILNNREIFLLHPKTIFMGSYMRFFFPLKVQTIEIPSKFFGTVIRGTRLGLSTLLYQLFIKYEYILLHQLDAYVFSDDLDYWCNQNLDFVGAPWFDKVHITSKLFLGVGNGGFSLRKVSSFLKISLNRNFILGHTKLNFIYTHFNADKIERFPFMGNSKLYLSLYKRLTRNEDKFWGLIVPKFYDWFIVASPTLAMKFSFEALPRYLYELNLNELPFGCHAWEIHDADFWKPFINDSHIIKNEEIA